MHRTKKQEEADTFDCDIYELVLRAARFEREGGKGWKDIADRINTVRPKIRLFMHPDDKQGTYGA